MKALKEFLEKIVEEDAAHTVYDERGLGFCEGRTALSQQILSEYLTDTKFCRCEMCKNQHRLIQEG